MVAAIITTMLLPREEWPLILAPFAVAFVIYAIVVSNLNKSLRSIRFWIAVGLLARLTLLFIFPNLSDDIYRFIWDGHLSLNGYDPFQWTPSEFLEVQGETGALTSSLFERLNSPDYYTVYPPISQLLYWVAASLAGTNILVGSIILKGVILLAEFGTIRLMWHYFKRIQKPGLVLLYALNPLVIIELVGNLHFEGVMIFGIVTAIILIAGPAWSTLKSMSGVVAGLLLGIGVKLLPVLFVPFLARRLPLKVFVPMTIVGLLLMLSMLHPMIEANTAGGPKESLELYFQTFEFNASIYYVLRWLGYAWKGYNMIATIGVLTSIGFVVYVSQLFIFEKGPTRKNWAQACLFALTAYLLLASIVHPWYICPMIALCCFTRFRYPIVWSGMAFLSYAAYKTETYDENLWLVGLEYVVVIGFMLWEMFYSKAAPSHGLANEETTTKLTLKF